MNPLLGPCVAELVGTFYLCFIGAGSICIDQILPPGSKIGLVGIALAHGLALAIGVSATMAVSGGQLNPAVSVALFLTKKIDATRLSAFVIAQLLGATLAGVLLRALFPAACLAGPANLGTPALAADVGAFQGIAIEAILTFFLVFSIFGTAIDPRAPKIGGFGIGLTLAFDILAGGPLTGAAINPARHLGIALVAGYLDNWWIYWVGPIAGAVAGAFLYQKTLLVEKPAA